LVDLVEKPNDEEWDIITNTMPRIGISWNIFSFTGSDLIPFLENTPLHPIRNEKEIPVTVKRWASEIPKSIFAIQISDMIPDLNSKQDIADVMQALDYEI
jgi:glucose-1-phosphate adenylyltransferase